MNTQKKQRLRQLRIWRIRKKVAGTAARPRLSATFTGQHIYVQFINDELGLTLAAVSTRTHSAEGVKLAANIKSATIIGKVAAAAARAKGISTVVFDRRGAQFNGKIKALADAAREEGLIF